MSFGPTRRGTHTTMADRATRARELYGGSEFAPLWRSLWQRFSSGLPVSSVRLRHLDHAQCVALADLLGLDRLPRSDLTVQVRTLDAVLAAWVEMDSRAVVEAIVGPLANRAEDAAAARQAREELWAWLEGHPIVRAQPALGSWVAAIRRGGLIDRSPAKTRDLVGRALSVLSALPADGRPLSTFAGEICGDTHALDDGTRLAAMVLRALAALHGEVPPQDVEQRRACWERAGIACDALSTVVLTAGFRPRGANSLALTLRTWTESGQAAVITLAQLKEFGPLRLGVPLVRAVENPALVAMAVRRLGARCPPLLTTAGWPNSASMLLMRQLTDAGVEVRYHGDFDGEGLRIAAHVFARTGARPWRMSAQDYLPAVRAGRPEPGNVTDAPWDPALSTALRTHQATVSEEHVAEQLLADLMQS